MGLTPLPASGRGGSRAWVPAPCLPPALGRVHPPLPVRPAPSPKRAAPSAASTAPPIAPPAAPPAAPAAPTLLLSELAHLLDEPTGLGVALAAPVVQQGDLFSQGVLVSTPPAVPEAPSVSSRLSGWLEQQQLAEVLEDRLTGAEAIEVVETCTGTWTTSLN